MIFFCPGLVLYRQMFWTDMAEKSSIKTSKMNGEDAKKIVTTIRESPGDLAIDTIEDKLYWTDTSNKRINWITLSGTSNFGGNC